MRRIKNRRPGVPASGLLGCHRSKICARPHQSALAFERVESRPERAARSRRAHLTSARAIVRAVVSPCDQEFSPFNEKIVEARGPGGATVSSHRQSDVSQFDASLDEDHLRPVCASGPIFGRAQQEISGGIVDTAGTGFRVIEGAGGLECRECAHWACSRVPSRSSPRLRPAVLSPRHDLYVQKKQPFRSQSLLQRFLPVAGGLHELQQW